MPQYYGTPEYSSLLQRIKNNDQVLTSLDLGSNEIDATGAKELANALKDNRTLTSLGLGHNNIGATGAKELAGALKANQALTSLELGSNEIDATDAKELANALKTNRTLTSLELKYNEIGDTGAKKLASALKANRTLTSLRLWANKIGDTGAKELASALKDNQALTSLGLGYNKISDTGVKELASAFKDNRTLTSLELGHNQIGATGAKALASALKDNRILRLTFEGINIDDIEPRRRFRALKDNQALTSLESDDNNISNSVQNDIDTLIGRNCEKEQILKRKSMNLKEGIEGTNIKKQKTNSAKIIGAESKEHFFEEMSDIEDYAVNSKTPRKIGTPKKELSQKDKEEIGGFGESYAYAEMLKIYKEKGYKDFKSKGTDYGFQITGVNKKGEHKEVKVIWNNKESNTYAPVDIIKEIKRNGKKEGENRYIEIKATIGTEKNKGIAEITRNQLRCMRKYGPRFSIFRVYNVKSKNPTHQILKDPYKTLLGEPKLARSIQSIKIKI